MHWWWQFPRLLRRGAVHLVSDEDTIIEGVIFEDRGAWLIMREASVLKLGNNPEDVGETLIHRSNIAFVHLYS